MHPFPDQAPAAGILAELLSLGKPALGSGKKKDGTGLKTLARLSDRELLGSSALPNSTANSAADGTAAACVRAGLLLLADDLEASHQLSQSIETADGSYWHAILHRREGDFSNSKYWFRRVGDHPVFSQLADAVRARGGGAAEILKSGRYDPFSVVDLIEACEAGRQKRLEPDLLALQEDEMLLLLSYCYRLAVGARD